VKPTERPDEKDDREWYTDQPEQKTSTHNFLLFAGSPPNVISELTFLGADKFADPRTVRLPTNSSGNSRAQRERKR
jgi:hypothetical protein